MVGIKQVQGLVVLTIDSDQSKPGNMHSTSDLSWIKLLDNETCKFEIHITLTYNMGTRSFH